VRVLAERDLEAAEAGEDHADADRLRGAADDADDQADDPRQHRQLGEGELPPGSRGALVRVGDAL
jgi:hypothetical protein